MPIIVEDVHILYVYTRQQRATKILVVILLGTSAVYVICKSNNKYHTSAIDLREFGQQIILSKVITELVVCVGGAGISVYI